MGNIFESFEQAIAAAINAQVHEEMKPSFQLLDDRIVALEKGKATPTDDADNTVTNERVEAIVQEMDFDNIIENAISNGIGESSIESVVENYVEYNFDVESHIQNWMDYNLDINEHVNDALASNTDFGELQERVDSIADDMGGLESKVDDLGAIADSMDVIADKVAILESQSGAESSDFSAETEIERLSNRVDEYAEGTIGEDEVQEIRSRLDNLEMAISDIQEAIRSFGMSV